MIFSAPHLILPPERPAIVRASDQGLPSWQEMQRRQKATFPFPFFAPRPPARITAADHAVNATGLTTYTFTTRAIGAASDGRRVIVALAGLAVATRTISSVTIGGSTATQVIFNESNDGTGFQSTGIFVLQVDAAGGTTATIAVTYSGAMLNCGLGVWAAYNLQSSTATATATSAASPMTASLTVNAGGVGVAAASVWSNGVAAATYTWSGFTEDYDETVQYAGNGSTHSGASGGTAGTITVTATQSAGSAARMVAAAFR